MMKIDIHIHSDFSSDGQHSIDDIIKYVKDSNVDLFSITDHNTVLGVKEALKRCEVVNKPNSSFVNFITGIELSTDYDQTEIHLLAYGINPDSPVLADIILEFQKNRTKQVKLRVETLKSMGMKIDFDELIEAAKGISVSGVTILNVLKKYPENYPFIKEYIDGDKSHSPYTNFYFDFFFRGGKAFVYVPLLDYVDIIKRLKGEAVLVLAHPGLYPENIIDELVQYDIDGIEVYSSYHNDEKVAIFQNIAKTNSLISTSGSDFHGDKIKPGIYIGSAHAAEEKDLNKMLNLFEKRCLKIYKLKE